MRLFHVAIKNFRGLADIEFKTDAAATVIVGPNAIGKTSLLQAIRLVRALLMPVYQGEDNLTLQSLGALSPHTQQLDFDALLRDPGQDLKIDLVFRLTQDELAVAKKNVAQLAAMYIESQLGQRGMAQLMLVQYLSTPQGRDNLSKVTAEFSKRFDAMSAENDLRLSLTISAANSLIQGGDAFIQLLFVLLARVNPLNMALISYFPADRALPSGEVAMQIGSADVQQEMQSHIGQPELKHQRLKQYIVNQFLVGEEARNDLTNDFALIFDKLLPGKTLKEIKLSNHNTLSVRIAETKTGATYDIDSMSSGEKGLLLTFLLARRRMVRGGLLLLDEPELHLNPAVCRKILPFIVEDVAQPMGVQVLLCTHSPEILATAFERDDCNLFHLKSPRELNRIHRRDKEEAFEALKRLGTSTADVLFFRGGLHVEGPTDADLLELGFSARIGGLKVSRLGGRDEVEKEIRTLQSAEARGQLETTQCFILDHDGRPTTLTSTGLVRVVQWDRRCFENYLLDQDAIFDATREIKTKKNDLDRAGFGTKLKELAIAQLASVVARKVYGPLEPENGGIRPKEITGRTYDAIANALSGRIARIADQVREFRAEDWAGRFVTDCVAEEAKLRADWEAHWHKLADGKQVLESLHHWMEPSMSVMEFKKAIVRAMAQHATDNWKAVDSILSNALK